MTMPVIDAVSLEESGIQFQVVEPGSPEDPFTTLTTRPSSVAPAASPATVAIAGGEAGSSGGEGLQVQPVAPVQATQQPPATQAPAATPAATATTAAPPAEETELQKAVREGTLDQYIAGLVAEQAKPLVGQALRNQQSAYDKQINSLKEQLQSMEEVHRQREREAKLAELSPQEQQVLKAQWDFEDKNRLLDEREKELDAYWRQMYVVETLQSKAQFGVTAEELEALQTPEEIDAFIVQKELEFYRNGGASAQTTTTAQVPTREASQPASEATAAVPAGATAPTDLGGSAPVSPPPSLDSGKGLDAIALNLSKLPLESLRI